MYTFNGHTDAVSKLEWSNDGHKFVSASADCTAKLWDIRTMQIQNTFEEDDFIWSVSISSCGRYVLTGAANGNVKLWSVTNGLVLKNFKNND